MALSNWARSMKCRVVTILLFVLVLGQRIYAFSAGEILVKNGNYYGIITHEALEHMKPAQRTSVTRKLESTIEIIRQKMDEALPTKILRRLNTFRIVFMLDKISFRDGLFVPPGSVPKEYKVFTKNGERELHLVIHPLFLSSRFVNHMLYHEFFHAIHFALNPFERNWVREGLAELFPYLLGQNFNSSSYALMKVDPFTPLRGEFTVETSPSQYGHSMMFFYYLFQHCGKEDLFWAFAKGAEEKIKGSDRNSLIFYGKEMVEKVLQKNSAEFRKRPQCKSYHSAMTNFEIARIHNRIREDDEFPFRYLLQPTRYPHRENFKISSAEEFKKLPLESSATIDLPLLKEVLGKARVLYFWVNREYPFEVKKLTTKEINAISAQDAAWNTGLFVVLKY